MSDQEEYYFVQTLRHYPKISAGWNQYNRDSVTRKRVARTLDLALTGSGEHLMAIRYWRVWRA